MFFEEQVITLSCCCVHISCLTSFSIINLKFNNSFLRQNPINCELKNRCAPKGSILQVSPIYQFHLMFVFQYVCSQRLWNQIAQSGASCSENFHPEQFLFFWDRSPVFHGRGLLCSSPLHEFVSQESPKRVVSWVWTFGAKLVISGPSWLNPFSICTWEQVQSSLGSFPCSFAFSPDPPVGIERHFAENTQRHQMPVKRARCWVEFQIELRDVFGRPGNDSLSSAVCLNFSDESSKRANVQATNAAVSLLSLVAWGTQKTPNCARWFHSRPFPPTQADSKCLFKYDFNANDLLQWWHSKCFKVEWVCMCALRFDLSANALPQCAHP